MDKQLVIFYAKRHLFGIVGILLAIGFIVGGVMVSGKSSASLDAASQTWEEVKGRRDKIQNSPVKVDMKNVTAINTDADSYEKFINNSIIGSDEEEFRKTFWEKISACSIPLAAIR